MSQALLVVRVALAAVFVLAGLGKLSERSSQRSLLETFELGAWARPLVRILPLAELAVAAGLLVAVSARLAAIAAAVLLVVFSALLARNARHGRETSCNCFGSFAGSAPGRYPLARNVLLLAASLLVALEGAGSPIAELASTSTGQAGLAALLACVLAAAVVAWRRHDSGVGRATGARRDLAAGARRTLVAFLEPGCSACRSLLPVLARFDGAARDERLVVVTSEPFLADADFAAALASASRHLHDDGRLAARHHISATPAALVLGPGGELERVVVGAPGVERLLAGEEVAGGASDGLALEDSWAISRRRLVASGLTAVAALPGLARLPQLRSQLRALAAPAGIACPSCGSCLICSKDSSSSKLSCGPCSQHCSGLKLCKSFANEYAPFTTLAAYLRRQGFAQDGDMVTHGLDQDGKLTVLSGGTNFTGGSAATPKAMLIYNLTNGGQSAFAALTNAKGVVTSVATVVNSQVVTAAVSPPPASAATSAPSSGSKHGGTAKAQAATYSCTDICSFAMGLAQSVLVVAAGSILAPETAALGLTAALFSAGVGLISTNDGLGLSFLLPLVQASSVVNGLIEGVEGLANAGGQLLFCENFACKQLKSCCTSNGACYDSDAECEHDCPGGLAHPMSHCNVYLSGKLVSKLIAP